MLAFDGFDESTASLLSGSIAGAIGVGVSYPLDSIKTKTQAFAAKGEGLGVMGTIQRVLDTEGLIGFYQGVGGVMVGQSAIKAVAFSSNAWALSKLSAGTSAGAGPSLGLLCIAAAFSGFVSSFVCNPVERIKVLMQAGDTDDEGYLDEFDCMRKTLAVDGLQGLLLRGLEATLLREVPGYCFYFVVYALVMRTDVATSLGMFASLFAGSIAGMGSWLPVYPVDVIKTKMQNKKTGNMTFVEAFIELRDGQGYGVFMDGITPKLLRASLNHAVCFFMYDLLMDVIPNTAR